MWHEWKEEGIGIQHGKGEGRKNCINDCSECLKLGMTFDIDLCEIHDGWDEDLTYEEENELLAVQLMQ